MSQLGLKLRQRLALAHRAARSARAVSPASRRAESPARPRAAVETRIAFMLEHAKMRTRETPSKKNKRATTRKPEVHKPHAEKSR